MQSVNDDCMLLELAQCQWVTGVKFLLLTDLSSCIVTVLFILN